jgi:hypothetical protein
MLPGPNGLGYFLVASDGGMFSYGDTQFYGSLGGVPLKHPIVAAATTPDFGGYWMTDSAGVVSNFGDATNYGSAPSPLFRPVVGMAETVGNGSFSGGPYPSGAYGFDVSKFQCGNLPSGDHTIAIVQADGGILALQQNFPNPCLNAEIQWAGAGLNLYTFFNNVDGFNGTGPECSDPTSCFNLGYNAGIKAFSDAMLAGASPNAPWWLDIEEKSQFWSSNTSLNDETIMGGLEALHNTEGVASVGLYGAPADYASIVGNYQPGVPFWMARPLTPSQGGPSGPASCADYGNWPGLPAPLEIVQFTQPGVNSSVPYDQDYAC